MPQKNRFMKFIQGKGIKTDILVVLTVFLVIIIYVLGLSVRNIVSTLSYGNKNVSEPIDSSELNQSYRQPVAQVQPQVGDPELLTQNPITKVRAILDNHVQINDSEQWYKVGDIVEGQAEIIAVEPTRILVEWNGTQTYIPLDYSEVAASEAQTSRRDEAVNQQLSAPFSNLTQEQITQMQSTMMSMQQNMQNFFQNLTPEQQSRIQNRMMQRGQMMQNMSSEEQAAIQSRMMQMGQRLQGMSEQQRQEAMSNVMQQMQQWMLSDQEGIPEFSLD